MVKFREIRSGQVLVPANDYLRRLYERQPKRYEKIDEYSTAANDYDPPEELPEATPRRRRGRPPAPETQ